jgi:MtN3 and saliva related transmembrane protein
MMIFIEYVNLIGTIAAILTTIAFIPQVLHSYRTKDLSGISTPMYTIFTTGVGMWLVYGIIKYDWPLIIANAITFCLAASILWLKFQQDI